MTNVEQDRWSRVKGRLRSSVGEDVYSSWFARMDLESVQDESVHLSVPTRFLKSWIQAHYAERVLTCWQAEMPQVHRVDVTVRTAMRVNAPVKEVAAPVEARRSEGRDGRPSSELRATAIAPVSATHEALGGSPLDPRLTFGSFVVGRSNTLAHAAARQVAEGRRGDRVMFNPLYIHAGV
ncbi:MAG: chromosomal replication initiator protein DnaA, partial [Tardiphaga sp.]|nr:chromosomal replication initiator protein DnaA [Tardiphaga sp.]